MSVQKQFEGTPVRFDVAGIGAPARKANPNNRPLLDPDAIRMNMMRLREIDAQGGIEEYANRNPTLIRNGMKKTSTDTVSCSDGRIIEKTRRTPGTALGSIHLLGEPEEKVKKNYERLGITRVTTHPGCGAAKAAYLAKYPRDAHAPDLDDRVMRWQQEITEDIAARVGVKHTPLTEKDMTRTKGHAAPLIIVNGTGKSIDPARSGLPNAFVVDRVVTPKYPEAVKLLRGVAEQPGNAGAHLKHEGDTMRVVTIARTHRDAGHIQDNIRKVNPDLKQSLIVLPRI